MSKLSEIKLAFQRFLYRIVPNHTQIDKTSNKNVSKMSCYIFLLWRCS